MLNGGRIDSIGCCNDFHGSAWWWLRHSKLDAPTIYQNRLGQKLPIYRDNRYGLANGVISPMQKSLLTQNAPTEMRGGIVSFDRLIQQVSKTTSTSIVGLMLVSAELPTIFWLIGILSLVSVALMALLLPKSNQKIAASTAS
jgi:hypothetical protein